MKNIQLIFLSILRFFKQNVVSLIGFILLVFFSVTIFTTLNSATSSLSRSFNRIKTDGNLHDFVINENYAIGNSNFIPAVKKNQTGTYSYNFTIKKNNWTNGHLKTFNAFENWIQNKENEIFSNFFLGNEKLFFYFGDQFVDVVSSGTKEARKLMLPDSISAKNQEDALNQAKTLLNEFLISPINEIVLNIIPIIFKTEILKQTNNDISVRNFNALDISANKQDIYFKMIETSPNFQVDNLVMFQGSNVSAKEDFSNFVTSLQGEYSEKGLKFFQNIVPTIDVNPNNPLPENASIEIRILHWTWKYIELFLKASWSPNFLNDKQNELLNWLSTDIYENVNPWNRLQENSPYFDRSLPINELFNEMSNFLIQMKGYSIINTEFSLTFSKTSLLPATGTINDLNSFEAVATPSYFEKDFINEKTNEIYKKEPIDMDLWNEIKKDATEDEFQKWLNDDINGLNVKNKLEVDNEIFVLLGSGLSPDFMYPIVNQNRPIPDQKTEELVYISNAGYIKMESSFRGNLTENFIVGKSHRNNLFEQINLINGISRDFMSWPSGINSTYANDDLNNIFSPASQRIVFIPSMIESINLISFFLTNFIVILTLIVIAIMIKRFIEINKSDLSILLANGFSKWELIFALTLIILLFSAIATTIGIFAGIALQVPTIGLFSQFWTLPIVFSNLSIPFFFIVFGISILTFGLMSIFFGYFSLKGDVVDLMKNDSKYHLNKLSRIIKKSVRKRSVLTIFRVSLAFSSPWKIISISTMSAIVLSSISFGVSSIDKFGSAARNTFESKTYENAIDLYSPTNAGGLYYTTSNERISTTLFDGLYNFNQNLDMNTYNEIVFNDKSNNLIIDRNREIFINPINQNLLNFNNRNILMNEYTNKKVSNFSLIDHNMTLNGNLHLPTLQDATSSVNDLAYVEYKTSSKMSLEHEIVFFVPWSIASNLLPSNTRRYFDENYELLLEELYRSDVLFDSKNASPSTSTEWVTQSFKDALLPFVRNTKIDENNNREKFKLTKKNNEGKIEQLYLKGNKSPYELTTIEIDPITNIVNPIAYGFIDNSIGALTFKIKENFINLIFGIEKNNSFSPINYSLNYKKIPIGPNDETYTTVEFDIISKNNFSFSKESLKAKGIKNDTKYVSLLNNGTNIKSFIDVEFPNFTSKNEIPIIANKFAERNLNLKIGDTLQINVLNDIMRFEDAANKVGEKIYNLKIVGFNDSFKDDEFYMSQKNANLLTGIKSLQKSIDSFPIPSQDLIKKNEDWLYGFNGIFTPEVNITQATQSISTYSPYNIYSGFDRISNPAFASSMKLTKFGKKITPTTKKEDTNFYEALTRTKSNKLLEVYNDISSPVEPKTETIDSLVQSLILTYGGDSIYNSLLISVEPVAILQNIFTNIENMTEIMQLILLVVINISSVIIILLITLIIISDSMRLAGILKALGLRSLSNASSFLMIYLPTIILGLLIAIPLTFLFNVIYSTIIFNFVGILISSATPLWIFPASASSIILIFLFSFLVTWRKIKTQKLPQVIK